MFIRKGERLGSVLVDKASTGPAPQPEPEPGQLTETEQEADRQADAARAAAEPARTGPQRPPTSGPGSGADAWRRYAAEVTNSPLEGWAALSRDEIIELLDSEGSVGDGA